MNQRNSLIKRSIANGDTETALNELLSFSEGTQFHDSAIVVSNNYQRLKKESLKGIVVKPKKWTAISDSILQLANEIDKDVRSNDDIQTKKEDDAPPSVKVKNANLIDLDPLENKTIPKKNNQADNTFEPIDYGVSKNGKGEFKLTDAPTVFFQYRFEKAFPGVRGLKWFEADTAVKRLALLLKEPTKFDIADGHGLYSDPIWWFRGSSGLPVDKFEILSDNRCLLDFKELKIKRIAAYNSSFYYKSFVYVEAEPDSPTGLYDYPEGYISDRINSSGYLREEYGLYKGRPISRAEYDDGAAEIDDDIVNFFGEAEFRARYLTRYNFILVAKTSPFNSLEGEILGDEYMDAILQGTKTVEDFAEMADELPKNYMDY